MLGRGSKGILALFGRKILCNMYNKDETYFFFQSIGFIGIGGVVCWKQSLGVKDVAYSYLFVLRRCRAGR